ncbi:hypothetical protein LOD99_4532 [Oopsacas minuta]|uniref:Uncharacterized protein n=1 Tax=Oopsacas minuta TaxID=111878 RepID=A0AAV7JTB3_9METZ|nr:hypothetical protein LOD99_4532 [Oopsacas minuta]
MEPPCDKSFSPNNTWEEIRELDDFEKWRDRNTIITKHEHKNNLRAINRIVIEIINDVIDSHIKIEHDNILTEELDVRDNTTLPTLNPLDFGNLLVDTNTGQLHNENITENNFSSENEFKPASNFDFELSYFEQLNSGPNIDYLPRDSLFRNFDPLASQPPPVCEKPDSQIATKDVPNVAESIDFLQEELIVDCSSSDSELSDNKENSFCSCHTKFPDEIQGDGLTSGEDYESTNEEYINAKPPDISSPISKPNSNNSNLKNVDNFGQDFFITDPIHFDEKDINCPLPTDSSQSSYSFENEEFRPSHEVDLALEYLEDLDIGIHDPNMARESLFTRFDPLTQQAIPHSELLRRNSQLSNPDNPHHNSDITAKNIKNANLLTFSTPPKKQQQTPRNPKSTLKLQDTETNNSQALPVYLDKPANDVLLSSNSYTSALCYTASEVNAEVKRVKQELRSKVKYSDNQRNELLAIEKAGLTDLIEDERKKSCYMMKVKEDELHKIKDEEKLSLSTVTSGRTRIEGLYQAIQANFSLLRDRRDDLREESLDGLKTIDNVEERMEEIVEDTERFQTRKCRVVSELDEMTNTLANFQTKISEASDSIQLNLNRISQLTMEINKTAKTANESETRYYHLEDKVMTKLKDANKWHGVYEREYNQKLIVLKTELRTKKMELSDLELEIKNFEGKNENLQGIAKEMMALHQPETK